MSKQFMLMSDEELDNKTKRCKNENTVRCEQRAHKVFTSFLMANRVSEGETDYWNYPEPILDKHLSKFWFCARKTTADDGEAMENQDSELKENFYKASSLRNFQYSLNRILKTKGHLYDITDKRTASFQKSQQAFVDAIKELKAHFFYLKFQIQLKCTTASIWTRILIIDHCKGKSSLTSDSTLPAEAVKTWKK